MHESLVLHGRVAGPPEVELVAAHGGEAGRHPHHLHHHQPGAPLHPHLHPPEVGTPGLPLLRPLLEVQQQLQPRPVVPGFQLGLQQPPVCLQLLQLRRRLAAAALEAGGEGANPGLGDGVVAQGEARHEEVLGEGGGRAEAPHGLPGPPRLLPRRRLEGLGGEHGQELGGGGPHHHLHSQQGQLAVLAAGRQLAV